jgi:hypothetical protein
MAPQDLLPDCLDNIGERLLFCARRIEPTRHVATSHHKRVAGGYRERVPETDYEFGLQEDASRIRVAERALRLRHVNRLSAGDAYHFQPAFEADGPTFRAAPAWHPPLRDPGELADGTEMANPNVVSFASSESAADQRRTWLEPCGPH